MMLFWLSFKYSYITVSHWLVRTPWSSLSLVGHSGPQPGDSVALESMSLPGSFVGVDTRVRQHFSCHKMRLGISALSQDCCTYLKRHNHM